MVCPFLSNHKLAFVIFVALGFILRKFTIPAKLLHPLTVVGGCNFWIASNLLLRGLMQTLLFCMNISFPIQFNFFLNNWHFFGDIFNPFFNSAFNKSTSFTICELLVGVKQQKTSMIASQNVLH